MNDDYRYLGAYLRVQPNTEITTENYISCSNLNCEKFEEVSSDKFCPKCGFPTILLTGNFEEEKHFYNILYDLDIDNRFINYSNYENNSEDYFPNEFSSFGIVNINIPEQYGFLDITETIDPKEYIKNFKLIFAKELEILDEYKFQYEVVFGYIHTVQT